MAIEIERKFLVVGDDWRTGIDRSTPMRQGYLGTGATRGEMRASVRVRLAGESGELNVKAAVVGSARAEFEYQIPLADAQEMLDTLCVGRVEKVRHRVVHAGHCWEIDEFSGDNAGLIVAEIELESIDESFARPAWLGRELTGDIAYYNHSLAMHPYKDWLSAAPR
jgi:adenylate cyclase